MTKARQLADLGNAYDDGALSNRNLIINGAMQVAQRGTSATAGGYVSLDRWLYNTSGGSGTFSQETNANPSETDGIRTYARVNISSSSDYTGLIQRIEDVTKVKSGTVTLSFWAKGTAPVGGLYLFCTQDFGTSGSADVDISGILITSTLTSSWVKYETQVTIPSVDGKTINAGSFFSLAIMQGTNTSSTAYDLNITGVQLEVGDTATPFEHRSYGEELAKCQRYYYRDNIASNDHVLSTQSNWNTTHFFGPYYMPVTMRANPTGSYSALSNFTIYQNSQTRTLTSLSFGGSQSLNSRELVSVSSSSITPQGGAGWLRGQGTGWIALDAEL